MRFPCFLGLSGRFIKGLPCPELAFRVEGLDVWASAITLVCGLGGGYRIWGGGFSLRWDLTAFSGARRTHVLGFPTESICWVLPTLCNTWVILLVIREDIFT